MLICRGEISLLVGILTFILQNYKKKVYEILQMSLEYCSTLPIKNSSTIHSPLKITPRRTGYLLIQNTFSAIFKELDYPNILILHTKFKQEYR